MGHLGVHLGLILASGQSQLPNSHGILKFSGHCNVYWAPGHLMPLFLDKKEKISTELWIYGYRDYNKTIIIWTLKGSYDQECASSDSYFPI